MQARVEDLLQEEIEDIVYSLGCIMLTSVAVIVLYSITEFDQ